MEKIGGLKEKIKKTIFEPNGEKCPECGQPLYRHKKLSQAAGYDRVVMCFNDNCKYTANHMKETKRQEIKRLSAQTLIDDATSYFTSTMLFSSSWPLMTFQSFQTPTKAEQNLKQKGIDIARQMAGSKPMHVVLTGTPGTGKTHLGMAILQQIMVNAKGGRTYLTDSGDRATRPMKAIAVSWTRLLDLGRDAIRLDDARERYKRIMEGLRFADVVLLDDLGDEAGTGASDYARNMATTIFEEREDLAMIITTNLGQKDLQEKYGARVISRLLKRVIPLSTAGIRDHRIAPKSVEVIR